MGGAPAKNGASVINLTVRTQSECIVAVMAAAGAAVDLVAAAVVVGVIARTTKPLRQL